ncbi:zinc-ribbon domain-containing protein [Candidatus Contubernalis alkaliaceticus]|uniref:zinc-ribbon domain-containing protein n=1 Tax=Candidatus Contubernalis alkaliaceticus TaxID=338645 RepID=UPI001F4BE790|nr:zinc-ribbon domain-containing protein [Candidatus Contubernalis alkalaceticus]UNC91654.1 zinc-ribbon domain-containing protein [Candidatus Contubernalis alkalaceticus]
MNNINFKDLFKGKNTDVTCPNCHTAFKVAATKLLESGHLIECPSCGFKMVTDESVNKSVDNVNKSIKNLQKNIDRLNKS